MSQAPGERRCRVCDRRVAVGSVCPHCSARLNDQRKLHGSAWMLAGGAALLLVALALWVHQLGGPESHSKKGPSRQASREPMPDGTIKPGKPVPVPFGLETCVPWNVSAAVLPPPDDSYFLVLTSRVTDPFGLVLSGFAEDCVKVHGSLIIEDLPVGGLETVLERRRPTALVVVGTAALLLAQQAAGDLPMLFALIPNPVGAGLDRPGLVGVTPWVPVDAMMRHLLAVLPKKKTLAVMAPAGTLAPLGRAAAELARSGGRKTLLVELSAGEDPGQMIQKAGIEVGAWIVFPDRQIIDQNVFNRIQVAAQAMRIPVGVSDEEHVLRGTLVGVGPDSYRIGRQVCHLAGALARKMLPEGSQVFCPEYTFAVIHQAVAEKLGYQLDPQATLQVKLIQWH